MKFHDRKKEIEELHGILDSNSFEFIIIYGRRRIGKTELILQATKDKKRVYYLGIGEKNLERFYNVCIDFDSNVSNLKQNFEILFNYLKDRADVIIIDEFQNLIRENKNILSLFQSIIDQILKSSKLKLIFLGSSISLIKSLVLSYKSPLYGRRTGSIDLKPINFFNLNEFFIEKSSISVEKLVEIYGFTDGIPFYLIKIAKDYHNLKFWSWLSKNLLKKIGFIRDEVDFLMLYEFHKPQTYKLILEAIAYGKTKLNDIKNFCKFKRTDLSQYLRNLISIGLIKREIPIMENVKSRHGRYYIKDQFIRFWFRFIYPNQSSIESGMFNIKIIKSNYSHYLGKTFEDISKYYMIKKPIFNFTKLGRWWWKDKEIDLIALNEMTDEILFIECKWKENVNPLRIINKLTEKTQHVKWKNSSRKESFCIFAKSFGKKIKKYDQKTVKCINLDDLREVLLN